MVLTDDDFATIEAAVEEGRGVFDNLTKFIVWTLPTNVGEGMVILVAILLGTSLPILPTQILWINMTTAVALGPHARLGAEGARDHGAPAARPTTVPPDRARGLPDAARLGAARRRLLVGLPLRARQRRLAGGQPHRRGQRLRHGRGLLPVQLPLPDPPRLADGPVHQPVAARGRRGAGTGTGGPDLPPVHEHALPDRAHRRGRPGGGSSWSPPQRQRWWPSTSAACAVGRCRGLREG